MRVQAVPGRACETVPLPRHSSARTASRDTFFATPCTRPPTLAATCVPWPLQSSPGAPLCSDVNTSRAREPGAPSA